jgi:hypothetical protein
MLIINDSEHNADQLNNLNWVVQWKKGQDSNIFGQRRQTVSI